ncbi:mitochondrial tRNA-specific 2-thiouridylase 1, partial [Trichonephila clavata]
MLHTEDDDKPKRLSASRALIIPRALILTLMLPLRLQPFLAVKPIVCLLLLIFNDLEECFKIHVREYYFTKLHQKMKMSSAVKKVVCAMSGGVDSSVAALLLKNRGFQVQGVFMRNWDIADEKGQCQADREKEDAEYACKKIGIPLMEVNFVKEYWHNVFSYLINEYKAGYTPNPDIHCNKKIKFDLFFKYALKNLKADAVATGHYARIAQSYDLPKKGFKLLKGVDKQKDQTFFLAQIPKYSLEKCIFPVGEMTKDIVKKIAAAAGLDRIVKKRESVGICFIGRRNFQDFIDDYIEPLEGNFINVENKKIVGKHKGVHCWTIGQRCALPGQPSAFYVAERDAITQDILVVCSDNHCQIETLDRSPHFLVQ